jgi:hypothetical protein
MKDATTGRPIPRCCGYCQSRDIEPHCPPEGATQFANCFWLRCRKCKASTGYTRALRKGQEPNGLTWRLVHTTGVRVGY